MAAFLLGASVSLAADDPSEGSCSVVATDASGSEVVVPLASLHVLGTTAPDRPFTLPSDAPSAVKVVVCGRTSPVPAALDDRVVLAGYTFAIVTESKDGRHLLSIELSAGHFQARYDKDTLTTEEQAAVASRMSEFQQRLDSGASKGAKQAAPRP